MVDFADSRRHVAADFGDVIVWQFPFASSDASPGKTANKVVFSNRWFAELITNGVGMARCGDKGLFGG